ncbi:MAG: transposase [Chloroflexales bacterium]|nr:transposase [Chloroflexales bacterium]
MAAEHLVTSQQPPASDRVGPVLAETSWPARPADGLEVSRVAIDGDAQQVIGPAGRTRLRWTPGHDQPGAGPAISALQVDPHDGMECRLRAGWTPAQAGPRTMKRRPQEQHGALPPARQRQVTAACKQLSAARAGIDGALAPGVRACGLRRTRSMGCAKTHLHHILIAVAITIVRAVAWIGAQPRHTPARALCPPACCHAKLRVALNEH